LNGIVIGMSPTIVSVGHFMLRWYGLFFMLGIASGIWLGLREARRKGFDPELLESFVIWAVVGGMVGARLFHVVDRWDLYAADPLRAFAIWEGGLAVYGGMVGGVLAGVVFALRHKLAVWKLADAAAPGMILGQAVGRLACIPNGDAYGAPTHVPWAFIYTNPESMVPRELLGVPLHPYPVYELLFDLVLLGLLWRLRGVFKIDGLLFLTYVGVYAVGRFLLTYFRIEQIWFWGLQEAQVVALLALAGAVLLLVWRLRAGPGRSNSRSAARQRPARLSTGPGR
jgi:phosphatidylglycerol:prolipoprotein diacylglycerol transferase